MELEVINKLYLELSQVATATTKREIELANCIETILNDFDEHKTMFDTTRDRAKGLVYLINMNRA